MRTAQEQALLQLVHDANEGDAAEDIDLFGLAYGRGGSSGSRDGGGTSSRVSTVPGAKEGETEVRALIAAIAEAEQASTAVRARYGRELAAAERNCEDYCEQINKLTTRLESAIERSMRMEEELRVMQARAGKAVRKTASMGKNSTTLRKLMMTYLSQPESAASVQAQRERAFWGKLAPPGARAALDELAVVGPGGKALSAEGLAELSAAKAQAKQIRAEATVMARRLTRAVETQARLESTHAARERECLARAEEQETQLAGANRRLQYLSEQVSRVQDDIKHKARYIAKLEARLLRQNESIAQVQHRRQQRRQRTRTRLRHANQPSQGDARLRAGAMPTTTSGLGHEPRGVGGARGVLPLSPRAPAPRRSFDPRDAAGSIGLGSGRGRGRGRGVLVTTPGRGAGGRGSGRGRGAGAGATGTGTPSRRESRSVTEVAWQQWRRRSSHGLVSPGSVPAVLENDPQLEQRMQSDMARWRARQLADHGLAVAPTATTTTTTTVDAAVVAARKPNNPQSPAMPSLRAWTQQQQQHLQQNSRWRRQQLGATSTSKRYMAQKPSSASSMMGEDELAMLKELVAEELAVTQADSITERLRRQQQRSGRSAAAGGRRPLYGYDD